MTMPVKAEEVVTRRPEPETEVETAPDEARGRTPTRGPELLEGTAMAGHRGRGNRRGALDWRAGRKRG